MNSQDPGLSTVVPPAAALGFPVVGIGASAGGFAALLTLLENMPEKPDMALVVVLHLSPDHSSSADKLLQRATSMPVLQVTYRVPILANQVYVIPPGRSLAMEDGHLVVDELERATGDPITVDIFFRTLAKAHGEHAVGVVLSGMGSDGVAGLASIKEHGGVAIAQLPSDAEASSMPQSAIESGMADFVLPAAEIPEKLLKLRETAQIIQQKGLRGNAPAGIPPFDMGPEPQDTLFGIFSLLRARTGHDFRQYKQPTLLRRLERRLQVRGVADLPSYHKLLETDHAEPNALLKDLLIGVTSFFRDRDAFETLEQMVVPQILQSKGSKDELRAWIAACSTGEEAYSMAMLLTDATALLAEPPKVQVFASDIDERAINTARLGQYPVSIAADVPPHRLQRYFTLEGDRYHVRKSLRDTVLFAPHNLLHDPAFSRLDIITCRNFLIYLNREMHQQLLETFHFALNPGGYLFLGSAESADAASHLFSAVDTKHRIYQARPASRSGHRALVAAIPSTVRPAPAVDLPASPTVKRRSGMFSFADIHRQKALELSQPSILVNAGSDIMHIAEHASRYLRHVGGEPTRNIVSLVPPELRLELRTALFQAKKGGQPVSTAPIRYGEEGGMRVVSIRVVPFRAENSDDLLMLVLFNDVKDVPAPAAIAGDQRNESLLQQLDEELHDTRQKLQETIDQSDITNAELRAANEELQSTVEELRSALEEQETSREELQSINEELLTVNQQLKIKAEETTRANDDLSNLIASTDIATIFIDREMRIKRYTPRITDIFNVISTDIGRPLMHLASRLDYPRLVDEAVNVFETLQPMEREVCSKDGRHYIVRVHPYRTTEDRIDGAVMTFFDITRRRTAEDALRKSEDRHRAELERQVQERTREVKESRDLLQATMDASMDMIQVFEAIRDERGEIVDFRWVLNNHTSESRYGEIQGESLLERNPGVVVEGIFDIFKQVVETGKPQQQEHHYAHEQFSGWFLQSVVKLGDGVATTTKEITEWKMAQEEVLRLRDEIAQAQLYESEAKYRHLIDFIPAAVYSCNADATLAYYNSRALELWGRKPNLDDKTWTLCGSRRTYLPDGTLLAPEESPMAAVLATGEPVVNRELKIERPDHSMIDILVNITALHDAEGNISGAVNIFQDITERKRAEKALLASKTRMTADLAGMQRLYDLHARLAGEASLRSALEQIIAVAIDFLDTDLGCVHLVSTDGEGLEMYVQRGFQPDDPFMQRLPVASLNDTTGKMHGKSKPLIVEDASKDPWPDPQASTAAIASGIAASVSVPMTSHAGKLLGVLSVCFRQPHHLDEQQLRLIDLLVWTAANAAERHQIETALHANDGQAQG